MGEQFNILLNQMLVFFTLIIIGFVAQKIKLLVNETIDGLSKLVVKLILPLMVFTTVVNGATISGIAQKMPFFLFSFLMIFILVGIGILSSKLMRLPKPTNYINTAIIGFPNTGFMGYPLLLAMFPETGPLAVAVYVIVDQFTFWTFMPVLTQKEITLKSINIMNMVKNPPFVALILGIICISFKLHPSGVAWDTMTAVGGTCKYFALIYIGADIGRRGFKTLVEKPKVFLTIPIKLIIAPVVVFFLFKFIGVLSSEDLMMITILAMLPSMVVLCMLAAENGSDADYATAGLIVTTLCSMATMPLVMKFLMAFL